VTERPSASVAIVHICRFCASVEASMRVYTVQLSAQPVAQRVAPTVAPPVASCKHAAIVALATRCSFASFRDQSHPSNLINALD